MYFEWDDDKRQSNIQKHWIDFIDVAVVFDGRPLLTTPSTRSAEERFLSIAYLQGRYVAVVWTWRGEAVRLISARAARSAEIQRFRDAAAS